jgi:selenocysteine-specific elongation factor
VAGDRFVLRQLAPPDTVGGGVVIDPLPRKHGAGPDQLERLRLMESGDPLERLEAQLVDAPSGLAESEAELVLLERLRASGRATVVGSGQRRYFAPARLEDARARLVVALDELGTGRPMSRGALADAAGLSDLAAQAVLDDLIAGGRVVARGPSFHRAAAARPDPRVGRLLELLRADGSQPRRLDELASTLGATVAEVRDVLERAVLDKQVERVKQGIYYHPDAVAGAERTVVSLCERDGSVTIATLRDELGGSRKYAQALLEYFDSMRLTRRQGDEHVLRRRAGGARV